MEHVLAEADREQLIRELQDISHTTKQRERLSRLLRRSSLRAMEEWASVQPPRTIFLIFTVPQKPRSHSLGLTQDSGRSDTTSATDASQSPHQRQWKRRHWDDITICKTISCRPSRRRILPRHIDNGHLDVFGRCCSNGPHTTG